MLFLLLFGMGDGGASQNYHQYPSGPLYPLPYEERRLSPWEQDWFTTMPLPGAAVTETVPAPHASDYGSTSDLLMAQVEPGADELKLENLELRKRIERLEELLKSQIQQPPVPQPQPKPAANGMKSVPGWLVEVHDWNENGKLGEDPVDRLLTRNCEFKGDFYPRSANNLYIYNFKGVLRVTEPGRHVLGFNLTCGYGHKCGFTFQLDGQELIKHRGTVDEGRLFTGVPLSVGDHTLEFKTWIDHTSFINYSPDTQVKWHPIIQSPGDFTFRDYRTDELFAVIPETTNSPVLGCKY